MLAPLHEYKHTYKLDKGIAEDQIWSQFVRPKLTSHDLDTIELLSYGLTEMVNKAIDHSEGKQVRIKLTFTAISVVLQVSDNGVGIFNKVIKSLRLADPRQALLELGKGKFTTDPTRHTGEGIFFSSRAFDKFAIRSANILFRRDSDLNDWSFGTRPQHVGTRIRMSLLQPPRRKLVDVFTRHSSGPEEYRFAKTQVPLRLATFGDESLLSRSSAKRVLARIEKFDEVLLDFNAVRSIGPAFADEIFRVFSVAHPHVRLIPINANAEVTSMIRRALSAASSTNQP